LRLANGGVWTPTELDAVDALVLALIDKIRGAKRRG